MGAVIGIDLGTTNSEVAVIRDGRPEIIPVDGEPIMPSCVGLDSRGELLVGRVAKNQMAAAPEATILSIKRKMGQTERVAMGDRFFSPEEIADFTKTVVPLKITGPLSAPKVPARPSYVAASLPLPSAMISCHRPLVELSPASLQTSMLRSASTAAGIPTGVDWRRWISTGCHGMWGRSATASFRASNSSGLTMPGANPALTMPLAPAATKARTAVPSTPA